MARGSIYVHFPYCLAKCPYCDFVSYAKARDAIDHEGYADAILREAAARQSSGAHLQVASIFFGGGTPSLWSSAALGRTLAGLRSLYAVSPDAEVTVECNPTSLDAAKVAELIAVGVTRLSIGTQSLDAAELSFLGRLHAPEGATAAVSAALAHSSAGLRVSTDQIFGLPGQKPEAAAAQASTLADLGLSHLSCYQLTIEPGTRFGELAKVGRLPLADDSRVAEAFLAIDEALTARGFTHYEISNYAKPGHEARHNLGYWRGEEYIGLGTGAFGYLRVFDESVRYRNQVDPARYVEGTKTMHVARGIDTLATQRELLPAATLLRERIMLGLRLAAGFDLEQAANDLELVGFTDDRERAAATLVQRGRLVRNGNRLSIPRDAWLFTDDISARLF